jgi:hypothetical protein
MPPAKQPPPRPGIDLETLLKMTEPLTVHVMRIRGTQKETIPLEAREGYGASGVGWTIEDVRAIDNEVNQVSGGGVYEVQVIDGNPNGAVSTRWTFILDPNLYPMKAPTTIPTAGAGYGSQAIGGYGYIPPAPTAAPYGYGRPAQPPVMMMQPQPAYGARTPIAAPTDPSAQAQLMQMQNELHRRDLAMIEERHRHERELQVQQQAVATSKRDPHVERELVEARRVAEEAKRAAEQERERHERAEAARQAKDERDAVERRAEDRARQIEAQLAADRKAADDRFNAMMQQQQQQQQQFQATLTQLMQRPTGPDPMVTLLLEQRRGEADAARETARIEAETQREIARLRTEAERASATAQVEAARVNSESQQRLVTTVQAMMAPNQMSPMDAARIVKDASSGADAITRSVIATTEQMLNMSREFTSNMLQMAPQGEGVAGRVVGALENAVTTWTQGQAQAQAAHANAVREQARTEQARMNWQPPPPVAPTGAAAPQPAADPGAAPSGPLNGMGQAPVNPIAVSGAGDTVRNGKSDNDWFGPALRDVLVLRTGAAEYLAAVGSQHVNLGQPSNEPVTVLTEDGKGSLGASPFRAAKYLVMAAAEIENKHIPVEAFNYFYKQQMYPALVEIILPDVPREYRDDVLRYFNRLLAGEQAHNENDPPMFGIDRFLDDEEGEEEADGASNGHGPTEIPPPVVRESVPAVRGARPTPGRR